MTPFDLPVRTRVLSGPGTLARLGEIARELGAHRVLLVTDPGMIAAGYAARARRALEGSRLEVFEFSNFGPNPDTAQVEAGRLAGVDARPDLIAALGGGSSLDCAKAINFVLTNGGAMHDYWGWGKATRPMLPMIGVPTTAGTGSEAQTYAIISDAATHVKMACGDPQAAFRVAILDPELTVTQPRAVTAASWATGRSLVPAVNTNTLPAGAGRSPGAGSQKVRATRSCSAAGKCSARYAACASLTRVARQSWPAAASWRATPPTHSAVLPSQKITSGKPQRCRRCRSTWA